MLAAFPLPRFRKFGVSGVFQPNALRGSVFRGCGSSAPGFRSLAETQRSPPLHKLRHLPLPPHRTADVADVALSSLRLRLADVALGSLRLADGALRSLRLADVALRSLRLADVALRSLRLADVALRSLQLADVALRSSRLADVALRRLRLADVALRSSVSYTHLTLPTILLV